jgi:hypothetical protein
MRTVQNATLEWIGSVLTVLPNKPFEFVEFPNTRTG